MRFLPNRMAGTMTEVRTIAGLLDHRPGGLVNFPSLERLLVGERFPHPCNGGIAGLCDDAEDFLKTSWNLTANIARPGQVAVNGARLVELRPQVDQHKIAFADWRIVGGTRLKMRITAMRADRTNGWMIGNKTVSREMIQNTPLDLRFAD